uniref:Phosphoinositide phospholipase C n=1 Tax=Petromyzon marinus TaxID=7757 RepID=S4RGR0_PETMA
FAAADRNGDGRLALDEIRALLSSLNLRLSRQRLHDLIQATDVDNDRGFLSFVEFSSFYALMSSRRDLLMLMNRHVHKTQPWQSDASGHFDRKPLWNVGDLARFMTEEQKVLGVTRAMCLEIIDSMEPNAENRRHGCLSLEGLTAYLCGPAGDAVDPAHGSVHQDMGLPLTRYCIASSHNTYLTGDQVTSRACADSYASVLRAGCRCVEVDSWDGPDGEPMVTHGRTLTTRIPFQDVLAVYRRPLLHPQPYPVIVSLENHCSLAQQDKMAHYLQSILGDLLLLPSDLPTADAQWPSPQSLMGKILLKVSDGRGDVVGDCSGDSEGDGSGDLGDGRGDKGGDGSGDVVGDGCGGKRCADLRDGIRLPLSTPQPTACPPATTTPSHSGTRALRWVGGLRRGSRRAAIAASRFTLVEHGGVACDVLTFEGRGWWITWRFVKLPKPCAYGHMQYHSLQWNWPIIPMQNTAEKNKGTVSCWKVEIAVTAVSLNYQTEGRPMQLNRAKFAANGNCGYVLKPAEMCTGERYSFQTSCHFNPLSDDPYRGRARTYLRVRVISGQRLPKPAVSRLPSRDEIIDPYVEVEVVGLPVDSAVRRTRVVDDNGFQPLWDETLVFIIHMPELAMVRFVVWDDDPIGRNFIGQKTIALSSILPGYRHVRLESLSEASIFVYVTVEQIHGK